MAQGSGPRKWFLGGENWGQNYLGTKTKYKICKFVPSMRLCKGILSGMKLGIKQYNIARIFDVVT